MSRAGTSSARIPRSRHECASGIEALCDALGCETAIDAPGAAPGGAGRTCRQGKPARRVQPVARWPRLSRRVEQLRRWTDDHRTVEHHGPPWTADPTTTAWGVDSHVHALEVSGCGRHLIAGCGAAHSRFTLWDTEGRRVVAEASYEGSANWLGFTPDGLARSRSALPPGPISISSRAGEGFRSILLDEFVAAAVHPSGASLVAASVLHRLLVVDVRLARVDRHLPVSFGSEAAGRHFNRLRWRLHCAGK